MPVPEFGTVKQIDPRDMWPNEASDFTPWLCGNLKALGDVLGMDLELQTREAPVGTFSLDILARDLGRDKTVVIENQLEGTDHDHLGKLLTYAAGYDAGAVIWVTTAIRDEHRQTIDWLNQHTDSSLEFYAVVIEVFKINDSPPAFEFQPVAVPSEWRKSRVRSAESAGTSDRGEAYRAYFQVLLDVLRETHHFTGARTAQPQNWCAFRSIIDGAVYGSSFPKGDRVRAEIYIDAGDADVNKTAFDILQQSRESIEREFGEPLEWERLDSKRASRIAIYRPGSIENDSHTLEEIRTWAVEHLLRLKRVFDPKLAQAFEFAGRTQ